MALRGEVVDLVGLDLLNDPDQVGCIGQVAIVQMEPAPRFMRVLIQMIDAVGIEGRCPPFDPMNLVALGKQEFGKIGAILTGDARNQGGLVGGLGHLI
jgi:hypothetical protein